jgi:hypothetical protein
MILLVFLGSQSLEKAITCSHFTSRRWPLSGHNGFGMNDSHNERDHRALALTEADENHGKSREATILFQSMLPPIRLEVRDVALPVH